MELRVAAGGIVLLMLCGCSGGGGGAIVQSVQGRVTQGPVKQATIFADRLNLGSRSVKDSDEVSTTTDDAGNFTLTVPDGYGAYVLVSQGGTDTVTNKPAMQMIAPAGSANVTPLTTLVALAPADKQAELKAKIEATGVKFDADISTAATPAALLLAKSVETAVETLSKTIDPSGTVIAKTELYDIQEKTLSALAGKFAATATAFTDVTALKSDISAAVTSAVTTIESAHTDIAVNNAATVAAAVSSTVDTVATSISSTGTFSSTTTVSETTVFTSTVQTTINNAVTSSATTATSEVTVTPKSDTVNPQAVYATPTLTGIAVDAGISVVFSEALAPATVNGTSFKVTSAAGNVAGAVSYDAATLTARFKPSANLNFDTTYTVTLGSGITDLAGNQLAATTLTFTTIPRPLTGSTGSSGTGANF